MFLPHFRLISTVEQQIFASMQLATFVRFVPISCTRIAYIWHSTKRVVTINSLSGQTLYIFRHFPHQYKHCKHFGFIEVKVAPGVLVKMQRILNRNAWWIHTSMANHAHNKCTRTHAKTCLILESWIPLKSMGKSIFVA